MKRAARKNSRPSSRPAGESPRKGPRAGGKIEIVHKLADDPEEPRRRRRVAVNARVDALEYEARRGRLSAAAYEAGRHVDAVLERAAGRRTGREFGQRDPVGLSAFSAEHALAARLDAARAAAALRDAMRRDAGEAGARVVALVLGAGLSFREVARRDAMLTGKNREPTPQGRDCERAAARVAALFRDTLETLAAAWERGPRP